MTKPDLFDELISVATRHQPESDLVFLRGSAYSQALTPQQQHHFLQFINLARVQQAQNPIYETIYYHLLHLYVLNGSRLDLLKTIDRRLRGLAEGQGALLLIAGVSGVGKTSLVHAFQGRMQQLGAKFLRILCSEQESTSYALWQDVARAASVTGMSLETLLAPIGNGAEARSALRLKQTLADWLKQCAAMQPLVILLDDLHWADADSLEMLNHLTSQPAPAPILYVATFRSEETHNHQPLDDFWPKLRRNRQVDVIHLQPLDKDDVERLVTAYLGACRAELVDYLHQRAEGHPLFTVELLNDLIAQHVLMQDGAGRWLPPEQSVPVPAFLKQLIAQRVNRLGDQVAQLLSVAAVEGEAWHLKIVEQVIELPEADLLAALASALRGELILIEDDKAEIYRFAHGLIREVLYSGQLARRRKRLHEQIAAQFEQQQVSNVYAIAHHYYEAENWNNAVSYCLAAGEQSARRFASYSALEWYQRALQAAERAGQALDSAVLFAIYDRLGRIHIALDQRQEAEVIYNRMRVVAQNSGDLAAVGQALVNLAGARVWLYQLDLAERTAHEALEIGEQLGDLRLTTNVHACLGVLQIIQGQLDEAAAHFREVLNHAEVLGDSLTLLDALRQCAYRATWLGQYQEAEAHARQALSLAQKSGDPLVTAGACQNLSLIQIESGQYQAAHQAIRATLEVVELSGAYHHQKPRLLNLVGYLHLELGDAQGALAWDQQALAAIHDTQVQSFEMRRYSLLNQATDYVHLGRLAEARDAIAQFEIITEGADYGKFRYFNRYQLLLCELHLAQKRWSQAITLAQEARDLAHSKGMLKNVAKSHWYEGQALAGLLR